MEEKVFGCYDLRSLIFSYLRAKADKECLECAKVLVWDKKVCDYTEAKENIFFELKNGSYCNPCFFGKVNRRCHIF
jgi:hypothetical protein